MFIFSLIVHKAWATVLKAISIQVLFVVFHYLEKCDWNLPNKNND